MTGSRPPIISLSFKFQRPVKAPGSLFPNFSAPSYPNVSERGNGMMSRLHHFDADKANLLYFSLGSESVSVIFANYRSMRCDYRACTSKLCMLTYRVYVLSNPDTPGNGCLSSERIAKIQKNARLTEIIAHFLRIFNKSLF